MGYMPVPTRTRPALGSARPMPKASVRQAPTATRGANHDPRRGFCNTPCGLCEADMTDSIRRNAARARRAR